MPRTKRKDRLFGNDPRLRANIVTIVVIVVVLGLGIWLLVNAANFGDDAPRSAVN